MRLPDGLRDRLQTLRSVADRVYDARREFLRSRFDGYVADTYYFVPDDDYYCWPALSGGSFEGFTELLPAERAALEPLLEDGFEMLGVGASRIACGVPPRLTGDEPLVVKIGRCGMGETYGAGRTNNLVEARVSTAAADAPVLPSSYCDPRGGFAVYPRATPLEGSDITNEQRRAIRTAVTEAVPDLRGDELADPSNLCRWNGDLYTLDYCEFDDVPSPMGVPDHVDGEAVIREVDRLRSRGEKRDIDGSLRLVRPSIAAD
ncbi:hypothetical protein [Halopiger goleimassiliensis]|uniref:hypothetical protein n=1 Tax=Halopiger goleimassiliensis TaxID=1293048 RepID=UPI00067762E3|nr:hypothetical protein [Halopiger goleimassiliensis]